MSHEHPIQQSIDGVVIDSIPGSEVAYWVGRRGIDRIEACTKSGLHADIAYIRVWAGENCVGEFCQHNIVGVYFARAALKETGSAE